LNLLTIKAFSTLIFELNIYHAGLLKLVLSEWVSFLAYPNLFGIKGFVVVVFRS
jgi:hypothetical protein